MKTFYYNILVLSVSILLFKSCSPKPITRVFVEKEDVVHWDRGIGIGQIEEDGLAVDVAFSHVDGDYIFFDFAFQNDGEEPYHVDVTEVKMFDMVRQGTRKAIDPELIILDKEIRNSKREANNKTLAIVAGAAIVAGTVAAVASADGGGSPSSEDNIDDVDNIYFTSINSDNVHINDQYVDFSQLKILSGLPRYTNANRISFWIDYSIRKTTLYKGEYLRGLVGFLFDDKSEKLELKIPLKETVQRVKFNQKMYLK